MSCCILIMNFFFLNNFWLFSIFDHFCHCKRSCHYNSDSTYVDEPCEQCSLIYPQIFEMHYTFQDIIVDERDFTIGFNKLFYKRSLISLDVCHTGGFFNKRFWYKTKCCQHFVSIRRPRNLFSKFLVILWRVYLNSFLSLLNLASAQSVFCRQETWRFCSGLMYDFCLNANALYFETIFCLWKHGKDFKCLLYKIERTKHLETPPDEVIFIEDDD